MKNDRRCEIIRELLERYRELVEPLAGNGYGSSGQVTPLPPSTYTPSVRELERLMRKMREGSTAKTVVLPNGSRTSIRSLWWNVNERYIRATPIIRDVTVHRRTKHGKRLTVIERQVIPVFHRDVDDAKVAAGVAWIAARWSIPNEPMLPPELKIASAGVAHAA